MRVSRVSRALALVAAAPSTRVSPSTGSTRGGAIGHRPARAWRSAPLAAHKLSGLAEVPLATAWRIDGQLVHDFPMTLDEVARAEPVYEVLPGWPEDITGVRSFAKLPAKARRYVERIEALVGVPIDVISVGPDRDQTITRRAVFQEEGA